MSQSLGFCDCPDCASLHKTRNFATEPQRRQATHRTFPGNRTSLTLAYPKLPPLVDGQIIAPYEPRVFVEGVIWGVELGKERANALLPMVHGADPAGKEASTRGVLRKIAV